MRCSTSDSEAVIRSGDNQTPGDPFEEEFAHPLGPICHRSSNYLRFCLLLVTLICVLIWYRETTASLVNIWMRSDTFAHGFLVAPISIWLIWRRRHDLRALPVEYSVLGIFACLIVGFGWLLGELASVSSVSQFALVGLIVSVIWATMGTAVVKHYAFPLSFLIFLVPFGEFLFPIMMDWTTHFVIGALQLFKVPVYAEGRTLIIPSGQWQVVEGCSGVRYLIASVVVGCLYSYLSYQSLIRRVVFAVASVALPVLANWIRAWGIVMLGHFSDNRIATGVDHIVYGWVFFGIIMTGMFWVGSRWQENDAPRLGADDVPAGKLTGNRKKHLGGFVVCSMLVLLSAVVWKPLADELDRRGAHGPVRFDALIAQGNWHSAPQEKLPSWSPKYSGMRGEFRGVMESADGVVGVYIGYYRDQTAGEELINSENRVLISKDPVWKMTDYGSLSTQIGTQPLSVQTLDIGSDNVRMKIWHWYWIGGRWTTNDYLAKLYLALTQLQGRGDDSAVVMIFTPYREGEGKRAEETLSAFMRDVGPRVRDILANAASH